MRYKENVLQKLDQLNGTVSRLQLAINRNMEAEVSSNLELIKEQLEGIKEMVSIEYDEFEEQFKGRII